MSSIGPQMHSDKRTDHAIELLRSSSDADWLLTGSLQKMVLVISSVASKEVLERWTFDIQTDKATIGEG